jgi:hypothetical protein
MDWGTLIQYYQCPHKKRKIWSWIHFLVVFNFELWALHLQVRQVKLGKVWD